MNTYRITLERISTGEKAPSMIVRQPATEEAVSASMRRRRLRGKPDLRVAEIAVR